jgi:hypothetical protein
LGSQLSTLDSQLNCSCCAPRIIALAPAPATAYLFPVRRSKEILLLLALLLSAMAFVLWYVADRRAQNRANPPAKTEPYVPPGESTK